MTYTITIKLSQTQLIIFSLFPGRKFQQSATCSYYVIIFSLTSTAACSQNNKRVLFATLTLIFRKEYVFFLQCNNSETLRMSQCYSFFSMSSFFNKKNILNIYSPLYEKSLITGVGKTRLYYNLMAKSVNFFSKT